MSDAAGDQRSVPDVARIERLERALAEAWHYKDDPNADTTFWEIVASLHPPKANRPVEPRPRRRIVEIVKR